MHVGTCSSFAIDTTHKWPYPSTCLQNHPTSNGRDMSSEEIHDEYAEFEPKFAFRGATANKGLDPNGYRYDLFQRDKF